MVEILAQALVLHHGKLAVLSAVSMALEAGLPTKTHILNLLHRLLDKPPDHNASHGATGVEAGQRADSQCGAMTPCAGRTAMRHDPASGATIVMLRSLKMHGMAQVVTDLTSRRTGVRCRGADPVSTAEGREAERELRSVSINSKLLGSLPIAIWRNSTSPAVRSMRHWSVSFTVAILQWAALARRAQRVRPAQDAVQLVEAQSRPACSLA